MKQRLLGRAAFVEYLLLGEEARAPRPFSLLSAPEPFFCAQFSADIAARRGRPLFADDGRDFRSALLPVREAAACAAAGREALDALLPLCTLPALPRTRAERDDLTARLAAAETSRKALENAGEKLGKLCRAAQEQADRTEEAITELTLTLEAARLDLLDAMAASLPADDCEAASPIPALATVFPPELLARRDALDGAATARAGLLGHLADQKAFVGAQSARVLAMAEAARTLLPAALGRVAAAAGLLDVPAGDLPLPAALALLERELCRTAQCLAADGG